MDWTEVVLGATRARLLTLLRRSRQSISGLASLVGITDNAVRTHVAAMQRDGMVNPAGVERATGGKPAQLYEITAEAEELFPKAYAFVLNELLGLLEERDGCDRVEELLREVGARAGRDRSTVAMEVPERVQAAAEVLRRLGGDVEVERGEGTWTVRGYGCPLAAVVTRHEEACLLAEALVSQITGLPFRECCDRSGRPRCAFRVGPPLAPADTAA